MNGRVININTRDANEKKILNVVEEMAIASGAPVPPVYLIEDHAINAFAAGYSPKDAVIGITRGCIRALNRDELQGVIAHEFSHIFNGDMRLNIRLISVLHGILVIGMIGYFILRTTAYSSHRRSYSSSSNNSKDGAGAIMFLGFGLIVIGYTGTFFGNLIKAAVSRQREFLADASAVQFTRNPDGIAGALQKIGGYSLGSLMSEPETEEVSHMLFSQGLSKIFSGFFSTHPPLEDRIKRINPHWNGKVKSVPLPTEILEDPSQIEASAQGAVVRRQKIMEATVIATSVLGASSAANPATQTSSNASMLDSIGEPEAGHFEAARKILSEIPDNISEAAHEPFGVRALMYCLLLDKNNKNIKDQQIQNLQEHADPAVFAATLKLSDDIFRLSIVCRLPLVDICLPALKQLNKKQYTILKKNMLSLIKADNRVDLFEWSLYRIVIHHMDPVNRSNKHVSIKAVSKECQLLLSAVALADSCSNIAEAERQFLNAWKTLGIPLKVLIPDALDDTAKLDHALKRVNYLYPLKKPMFLKACCKALSDERNPESIELIRAIGDGLDTPIPPMLNDQSFS